MLMVFVCAFHFVTNLHRVQGKRREGSETAVFYVSFISGFAAGSFAAFCVTPLDGKFVFCVQCNHKSLIMLSM